MRTNENDGVDSFDNLFQALKAREAWLIGLIIAYDTEAGKRGLKLSTLKTENWIFKN